MTEETKLVEKKNSLLSQILPPVIVALLVGGTSPWWFKALHNAPEPNPIPIVNSGQSVVPHEEPAITASRSLLIGRWRVNQDNDSGSTENTVDYYDNGKFEGRALLVSGMMGRKVGESGTWQVEILSPKSFRLELTFDNGSQWVGKFNILDKDHLHNIDENYVAERIK